MRNETDGAGDRELGGGRVGHDAASQRGRACVRATASSRSAGAMVAGPRRACTRNSTLPSAPRSGDGTTPRTPRPARVEPGDDLAQHRRVHLGIADDAPPGRRGRGPASNCGFTSSTNSASSVVSASRLGATVRSEMNERSATQRSGRGSSAPGSRLRTLVRSITRHAVVLAQRPRELAPTDVDREHVRGAALQQAVGEAAGRGADVERAPRPCTSTANASSAAASL